VGPAVNAAVNAAVSPAVNAAVGPAVNRAASAGPPTSHPSASREAGPRAAHPAAAEPLTVTISVDGGAPETRDRFLAALGDLMATVGQGAMATVGQSAVAVAAEPRAPIGDPAEPGVVHVDPEPRAAFRDGRLLELSRLEYDLLLFFARHPRQVFSRGQLLAEVWGHVHTGARTVDVHVSRLRQKLGGPELIATVYGVGYRLADAAPVRVVPPRAVGVSWTA
jgi:hypothetical protein